jgi:outer membrane immunogenic protein
MKQLLTAVTAAALSMTGAQAADMATRPIYTKAPIANVAGWTGFYAGVNVGYGSRDPSVTYTANDSNIAGNLPGLPATANYDIRGALGGGQIGYNWQLSTSWLVGIEADIGASNIKGTAVANFALPNIGPAIPAVATNTQSVDWFGTVRGRVGWLPTDRLLLFGTGGFAYGGIKESSTLALGSGTSRDDGVFGFVCTAGNTCFLGSSSRTATGWTAGGGFEFAVWRNFTFKAEYLYVNLGGSNLNVRALTAPFGTQPSSLNASFSDVNFNILRVGANYRF